MALLITCDCGHRLEAADDQAGQQAPCPGCGKVLQFPEAYNPLSTAKLVSAPAPAVELAPAPPSAGPPCDACAGSGQCAWCGGRGALRKSFLDQITDAASNALSSLADMLGVSSSPRKFVTRSEQRQAAGCPRCEATGKCFTCEGRRAHFRLNLRLPETK